MHSVHTVRGSGVLQSFPYSCQLGRECGLLTADIFILSFPTKEHTLLHKYQFHAFGPPSYLPESLRAGNTKAVKASKEADWMQEAEWSGGEGRMIG